MIHAYDLQSPAICVCAQAGCAVCLERLLRHHERLVHAIIQRQWTGGSEYADLLQEGRLGLWRAIEGFDPQRGAAFSTYAWPLIRTRIWRWVGRHEEHPCGRPSWQAPAAPQPFTPEDCYQEALQSALAEALGQLPAHCRQVLTAAYGLDGQPVQSLAALGRTYGVSRERVRQWRQEALLLLRLPAFSARLRQLGGQESRVAYRQAERLNQRWLRQQRGGRP